LILALEQDNNLDNCEPLVDWMQVALTMTPGQPMFDLPANAALLLIAPVIDEDLVQHQEQFLASDLPGKNKDNHRGTNGAIMQLAQAVTENTRETHEACLARDEEK